MPDPRVDLYRAKCALCGIAPTRRWVLVSVAKQRLWAYEDDRTSAEYACSTSAKPPGCAYGSGGTPLGLHRIAQKIGTGAPSGTIFEKREDTGKTFEPPQDSSPNLITSRILWLEGLEEGKNRGYECGSHNRKIYLHGTNHEGKVGTPFSSGCVLLRNADILALFDWACEGDIVLID